MSKSFPVARKFLALMAVILLGAVMLTANHARAEENEDNNGGIGIGISIDVTKILKKKKKQTTAPAPAPAKKKIVAKPKDASAGSLKPVGGVPPKGENRYHKDEVLFVLKPASPADALAAVVQAQNLRRIDEAPLQLLQRTVHRYAITDGRTVSQVITALEANPNIESAQPEYQYELTESSRSALGEQLQYANVKLRLDEAHKWVTGRNVVVAVINSRIDITHEALQNSIRVSYSAVDYPSTEADTHGTAMAGAIAGHGLILGTAPESRYSPSSASRKTRKAAWRVSPSTYLKVLTGPTPSRIHHQHELCGTTRSPAQPTDERGGKKWRDPCRCRRQCRRQVPAALSRG